MVDFANKLELINQKYWTNVNIGYEQYKGKFLFPMKDFFSFATDRQSMYFISNTILTDNINVVRVPQFQLAYISNTTNP